MCGCVVVCVLVCLLRTAVAFVAAEWHLDASQFTPTI